MLLGFTETHETRSAPGPASNVEFTLVGVAAAFTNLEGQVLRAIAAEISAADELLSVREALLNVGMRAGVAQPFARFVFSV